MSKKDRFLRACRREPVDVTPIWLMRQAGRYMPEYRALREKHSLLELVKNPELAAEVTLQPVRAFDVDAAIIFADILPLLEGLGLPLEFKEGEGPVIARPVSDPTHIDRLTPVPPQLSLSFTLDAIRLVKRELNGRLPLIGFSGAPFTLACYALEGGGSRDFARAKTFMYNQPAAWHRLLELLADSVGAYLAAQVEAGVDAVQVFDSWAGVLSPADYVKYVRPYTHRALDIVARKTTVPIIHFSTGTSGFIDQVRPAGGQVLSLDWRVDLAEVWARFGHEVAVQGNLDPVVLHSSIAEIRRQAGRLLHRMQGRAGYIFNLGHGVLPHTPPDHVKALVDYVHQYHEQKDETTEDAPAPASRGRENTE
jgi:uroporphyrinogen decarboxylase